MASFQFALLISSLYAVSLAKIYEIFHRDHYHDLMQSVPVGSRYASIIAFYNDTTGCQSSMESLPWTQKGLPGTDHLFLGQYEFSTSRERVWYEYADHLDLPKNIGIESYIASKEECECPILAFIPATYADALLDDYLQNPSIEGIQIWNAEQEPDWKIWAWKNLEKTIRIAIDLPFDLEVTVNHQTINSYLESQGKPWTQTIKINSLLSHQDIQVFPGDTIYISANPELSPQLRNIRTSEDKTAEKPKRSPSDGGNPYYWVHAAMYILNVIEYADGTWGFDDDRVEGVSAAFVSRRHATTMMTHTRNLVLPQVLPATHPTGFVKRKMPPGLHERMSRFYRKWYHLKKQEGWDKSGTQLNFYKVKTHMISLDHDFGERDAIAHEVMKPILLKWAQDNGATHIKELKFSAFYGIREYSRGASLRNHVDRVDTHVLSAILQVGQTGIDEPWPLQVIGFDGVMYDITLEPGEMILYEGHKLIHGRPYPFNGTRFANAFIHFAPVDWDWSTSKVWRTEAATNTLKAMHIDLRSIYR